MLEFLDAAYAMLLEDYTRQGMDISAALQATAEWAAGNTNATSEQRVEKNTEQENNRALKQLEHLMMGGSLG